jgi:hypothetical protein
MATQKYYELYAVAHYNTVARQRVYDAQTYPGMPGIGYSDWIERQKINFAKIRPDAFFFMFLVKLSEFEDWLIDRVADNFVAPDKQEEAA